MDKEISILTIILTKYKRPISNQKCLKYSCRVNYKTRNSRKVMKIRNKMLYS